MAHTLKRSRVIGLLLAALTPMARGGYRGITFADRPGVSTGRDPHERRVI